ncbi:NUDIX hydrolase [Pseudoalteromonas xiamenensis]
MRNLNPVPVTPLAGTLKSRPTARAIIVDGKNILLVYTKRYDDFGLPGGGIDAGESTHEALKRELREEIGAVDIQIHREFGVYEEYRPDRHESNVAWHIESYYYVCSLIAPLGTAMPEEYEINSGLEARWVNINDAIAHNLKILDSDIAGFSVHRELAVLQKIKTELMNF